MHNLEFDAVDLKILDHLQKNARASNNDLANIAILSASQCHRRVKRLEKIGVIKGYSAEIDPLQVGLEINAFVHVTLGTHGENPAKSFIAAIEQIQEIQECYSLTGDTDYLLRVAMPSLPAFSDFLMHKLMPLPMIGSFKSNIVLEEVRKRHRLPLGHLA